MIRLLQERIADRQSGWTHQLAGTVESHDTGTMLYQPGEPTSALLVLLAGKVGLFLRSEEGRSLTLKMVEPGQLFGHVALTDTTYDAYAEAMSDVRLLRVSRESAEAQANEDASLGLALLEEMGRYRQVVSQCLDELAFKSVPARLAAHLLALANRHGMNMPRVSHRQLAEQINAYRETVTKVINQFRAAHLLEIDSATIRLLNLPRLEELAQG
jgi:CRP/FNR family transcriptional regulator, cyclic AMP receptor protein